MTQGTDPFYADYTMISAWLRCRFYYYFRHVRHIVPLTIAAPLSFGKTWHSATEMMAKGDSIDKVKKHFADEYKNEEKDEKRTPEKGQLMLTTYEQKYNGVPLEFVYTETPFAIELPNNIILCGRIDAIVKWKGEIYVFERKTTSALGKTFFEQFELNYQIDIYSLACYELVGECAGAIIDVARVVKGKTSYDDFIRVPVSRTQEDLYFAKKNLVEIVEDIQRGPIYQNKDNCMKWFRKCAYHDLCMGACDERIIRAQYKHEDWDPSHKLKEKAKGEQQKLFKKEEKDIAKDERWKHIIRVKE